MPWTPPAPPLPPSNSPPLPPAAGHRAADRSVGTRVPVGAVGLVAFGAAAAVRGEPGAGHRRHATRLEQDGAARTAAAAARLLRAGSAPAAAGSCEERRRQERHAAGCRQLESPSAAAAHAARAVAGPAVAARTTRDERRQRGRHAQHAGIAARHRAPGVAAAAAESAGSREAAAAATTTAAAAATLTDSAGGRSAAGVAARAGSRARSRSIDAAGDGRVAEHREDHRTLSGQRENARARHAQARERDDHDLRAVARLRGGERGHRARRTSPAARAAPSCRCRTPRCSRWSDSRADPGPAPAQRGSKFETV